MVMEKEALKMLMDWQKYQKHMGEGQRPPGSLPSRRLRMPL